MDYRRAFGAILRKRRQSLELTQEQLAFAVGMDRTYISLLELGRNSPTLDTMVALARTLGVPLSELVMDMERQLPSDQGQKK